MINHALFRSYKNKADICKLFKLLFTIFTVSGCATLEPTQTEWDKHQSQLTSLTHYTAKGRLAYKGEDQRVSATLYWAQSPEQTEIKLINFLGKTLLSVNKNANRTLVTDLDGNQHIGHDINHMTYYLTGLRIPVEELQDWMIGLPTGADSYQLNEQQRLASLQVSTQGQEWEMRVDSYHYDLDPALPQKLTLRNETQRITVIINQWDFE
ncbi:lipoprotein insertase outer membrane protein LolB [Thaumasiovibrio subtropicus]|uniref:lipoprotein insertase outer membrane protein LolB n=1 Tax=Thaumasiovibrio subtropicus TaxID=1891207 RepID=UPI00131D9F77|nr:lipoprotein insertase outer membrane protein LolB [Thaumasiovibrio subtropicus]